MRKSLSIPLPNRPISRASGSAVSLRGDSGRDLAIATSILGVLFLAGWMVLEATGFHEQATDNIRYAVMLGGLTLASWIINARMPHPVADLPVPALRVSRRAALALAFGFVAFCAVLATDLDARGGVLVRTLPPAFAALVSVGAIRFAVEAVFGILASKRLGATNTDLALGRPSAVMPPLALLWIGVALVFVAIDLMNGATTLAGDAWTMSIHFFRASFPEEFLFRGLLMAVLAGVMRPAYANLVQALAFGVWHYGIDGAYAHGNVFTTMALMVCVQTVFGYCLGLLRIWTRSLAVPVIFHAVANNTAII